MKSTLRNMTLSLTGLTLFVGAALAGVSLLTAEPIREAAVKARAEAMASVLPAFDNDIASAGVDAGDGMMLFPAYEGGKFVGAAVQTFSDNGFSGRIVLMAGFDADGVLTGYRVLEHSETPGLGAKMAEWFCAEGSSHDVVGTSAAIAVKADGGDIDAITGATITSRAFADAINKARTAFENYKKEM